MKTYELDTILKQWSTARFKNKVVVFTYGGDSRFDNIHVDTFDSESDAIDFLKEELGDSPNKEDFTMFDLREGIPVKRKRNLKKKDNVVVLGGKYQGKRGIYLCSHLDDEDDRPFGYERRPIELGNSLIRVMDDENDEMFIEEIPTKYLDLE